MTTGLQRVTWPLTALAICTVLLSGCGRSGREEPEREPEHPLDVRVVPAVRLERADRIEAGGVVAAAETAIISSRIVAPVTVVAVRAGDRVRAGDVLVRLDAREMAAQVQQTQAGTRAAEEALAAARSVQAAAAAEHKLAAAWHARITQLRERNSSTAQESDEAEARLAAAAARAAAAQANVKQAEAQLAATRAGADATAVTESFAVIRAPFDGEVTERFTDPGNLATPGQPLLQIDASGQRRVDVRLDEARAAFVRPGDHVAVMLGDEAGTDDSGAIEGTVGEVARTIGADQRAFTVKVALPRGIAPRTGTFARIRIAGAPRQALVVPMSAVRTQGQLTSLFVVRDGVARVRLVQIGEATGNEAEIVAGLDAGETVVVAPPAGLTDGRRVTVNAPAATRAVP